MGKYDFSSPLAVGGAAIHDLLTQRKAEERQRLLDEVMVKDAASARAAREAQVRASEDQLKTEAQKRKLADRAAAMEGLEIGQQPRTPEQAKILEEYGMVESPSVEEVPVEATPFQMPSEKQRQAVEIMQQMGEAGWSEKDLESTSKDLDQAARMSPQEGIAGPIAIGQPVKPKAKMGGFVGTPKQREEKRVSDSIAGLRVITEDPNLSPDEKRLQVIEAMGPAVSQLPAGFWQQFGDPDEVSTYTFDQETGKTTEGPKVPAGSQFFTRPRPPREPRDTGTYAFTNPAGEAVYTFQGKPVTFDAAGNPKPYTGKVMPKPTAASIDHEKYDNQFWTQGTSQKLAELRARADALGTDLAQAQEYEGTVNAINTAKVSDPSVREAVYNIVVDGIHPVTEKPLTGEETLFQIADALAKEPGATETEISQFIALARAVGFE